MASRKPRIHLSSPEDEITPALSEFNALSIDSPPARGSSRHAETGILNYAYEIPSLQSSCEFSTASNHASKQTRNSSGHGRLKSHRFPSLFRSRKKSQGEKTTVVPESTGEGQPSTTEKLIRISDQDLMTGKCVTCNSMVRWPKELVVFRCAVCMTINDLKLRVSDTLCESEKRSGDEVIFHRVTPRLSNKKTRTLIEKCIVSYLRDKLSISDQPWKFSRPASPALEIACGERSLFTKLNDMVVNDPLVPMPIGFPKRSLVDQNKLPDSTPLHSRADTNQSMYSTSTSTNSKSQANEAAEGFSYLGHISDEPTKLPKLQQLPLHESGSEKDSAVHQQEEPEYTNNIFKQLEEYIVACLLSRECINKSFSTIQPELTPRAASEGNTQPIEDVSGDWKHSNDGTLSAMDAKTPLIGNYAENGSWWIGERARARPSILSRPYRNMGLNESPTPSTKLVDIRSPRIDWAALNDWYQMVICPSAQWRRHLDELTGNEGNSRIHLSTEDIQNMEDQILKAQSHVQRAVLKATESLLKRPGVLLREPDDIRFLLVVLANPVLYPTSTYYEIRRSPRFKSKDQRPSNHQSNLNDPQYFRNSSIQTSSRSCNNGPGHHSGIIKRILGLISNLPNECHHYLVSWFSKYPEKHFQKTTELIGSFVTYRLTRQQTRGRPSKHDLTTGLVPDIGSSGQNTSAALHAALGIPGQSARQSNNRPKTVIYKDDWQIKAAAKVMALLFSANNGGSINKIDSTQHLVTDAMQNISLTTREKAKNHGQILATSNFYNTLLDYSDLITDFETWESKRGKFSFCQYPFFLSIWAKIQIMEYDARRQMEIKAREAFFDSIMTRKTVNQYLVLKIRRECLVEDSLKGVSEVLGTGNEEIKKGLRIEFKGEEGIDAGGLRKEWFLLLVRDVFNPEHGMFTYDDESRCCYFNPNSFETSDQFFLVGVVLGLAIYNSTILDVALPSFAFRKLLAAGPTAALGAPSHAKPTMVYSLEDLAEFRPALAYGLQQLLEYEGNVEETYCRDFVADVEQYGQLLQVPLCSDGQSRPVTNSNRREFVDLYIRHILDTAVTRQFEPFKRGFFTVCGGNALSLFRPEEIELLIRGSDEPLDIASLKAVSTYENWGTQDPSRTEPVIGWFWDSFEKAIPKDQRKLLGFITGSDRIPAMGATSLVIKISCLGDDSGRFPVARTCFNMLSLWRYTSREKLERMLWRAVNDSEGFGLK